MRKEDLDKFYDNSVSYLQENLQEPELSVFKNTLEGNELLKKLYFQLKDVWEYHQIKDEAAKIDLEAAWNEMATRHRLFDEEKPQVLKKRTFKISTAWQVAASVVILIGVGLMIGRYSADSISDTKLAHVIECPNGDMVKLNLSDGTEVWLNSDSRMTMAQDFSPTNRTLSFRGEAFFNVKSDPENPFRIDVAGRKVNVMGTRFNLRYYPEENLFQTSLEEGSVVVENEKERLTLSPGEQLSINTTTGKSQLTKNNEVQIFSAWRTGRLEFNNMPMEQLIQNVERWHNHEIILKDPELMNMKLSGVLKRNKSVEHFMKVLSLAQPISYTINGDTIIISKANK